MPYGAPRRSPRNLSPQEFGSSATKGPGRDYLRRRRKGGGSPFSNSPGPRRRPDPFEMAPRAPSGTAEPPPVGGSGTGATPVALELKSQGSLFGSFHCDPFRADPSGRGDRCESDDVMLIRFSLSDSESSCRSGEAPDGPRGGWPASHPVDLDLCAGPHPRCWHRGSASGSPRQHSPAPGATPPRQQQVGG